MSTSTVLYVINNLWSKKYGSRFIVRQVDESLDLYNIFRSPERLAYVSDCIIKFTQGQKPEYMKNRSPKLEPYDEKQLAWMLLKAKTYGSIKKN